jgi:hypothetical protein
MAKGNLPVSRIGYDMSLMTGCIEPLLLKLAELAVRDRARLVVVRNVLGVRVLEYRD